MHRVWGSIKFFTITVLGVFAKIIQGAAAAIDHHDIRALFTTIYIELFISTGLDKMGRDVIFHLAAVSKDYIGCTNEGVLYLEPLGVANCSVKGIWISTVAVYLT